MIVLDTNVLSETLRPVPSDIVRGWFHAQERTGLFVTTVTQAEILYGVETLPAGKRKVRLSQAVDNVFSEFEDRILPFDQQSARAYAKLMTLRSKLGLPISQLDAMIAAISLSNGAAIATRDAAGFEHCGVELINPWEE
jgi:toxin FitB